MYHKTNPDIVNYMYKQESPSSKMGDMQEEGNTVKYRLVKDKLACVCLHTAMLHYYRTTLFNLMISKCVLFCNHV